MFKIYEVSMTMAIINFMYLICDYSNVQKQTSILVLSLPF